jgi:hypothetical protein
MSLLADPLFGTTGLNFMAKTLLLSQRLVKRRTPLLKPSENA